MDAADTMTPHEWYVMGLVSENLSVLQAMFPDFAKITDFNIDHHQDKLHLKGSKTILSVPLNRVVAYLESRDANEKEKKNTAK